MKQVSITKAVKIKNQRVKPFDGEKEYLATGGLIGDKVLTEKVTYKTKPSRADLLVTENQLIVARMKETNKVLLIDENTSDLIVSTGFLVLDVQEGWHPGFLFHYFASSFFQKQKDKLSIGATQKAINNEKFKEILIPEISLEDQKRIVKMLDKADALRQKRKQAIGLLDDYLKSVFLEMFGDPFAKNPKFKIVKLQDIVINEKNSIVDGPFGSSLNNNDYFDTGIPIIRINNVRDSGFYDTDFKYISEKKYNELIRSKVEYNDILIPRVGNSIGKLCLFNQKYKALLSTTGVAKASIDIKIANLNFVLQQMRLPQYSKYIWNQAEGGGQPYLNLKKIKNFIILLPPMELQNKFSEIVQKNESLKKLMHTQSAEIETQFQALMQKAFKGEL
jgi:type I restriction enzyme S subunit